MSTTGILLIDRAPADLTFPEETRRGRPIREGQILQNPNRRKAASVDGDAQTIEMHSLRAPGAQQFHIVRKRECAGHPAGPIVVAGDNENWNPAFAEVAHFANEEKAGVDLLPVAVEDFARNHQEVHLLLECEVNEVGQGTPRDSADFIAGGFLVTLEINQWAVEMNVRGMDESHRTFPFSRREQTSFTVERAVMSREERLRKVEEVMDQMAQTARERGLTEEKLEELLNDADDE